MTLRHVALRQVADTDLARAIEALVTRYGSDEKLAAAIPGANRHTVMRWRTNGTVPEKPEYVEALAALGVPEKLLADARAAISRGRNDRLEQLEAEVAALRKELDLARRADKGLLQRVAALETSLALQPRSQRATRTTRKAAAQN